MLFSYINMILCLRIDLFCKFCLFSVLIDSLRCLPVFEKFTKKYWFDKRELKNFGENIKGIKLVQDEFRIGIISHLPEVKRYLQREMLENVARRRKNLEDQYYNGRTTQDTAPHFVNQLPRHSKLLRGNSAMEEKNAVKVSEGYKEESHSPSRRTDEERSAKIRKRAVFGEVQESELVDHSTTINEKSQVETKEYNRKNFENYKERIRRKIDDDDDDDEDDDEDEDGDEVEDDSNIASTEANKLNGKIHISVMYKNSSYSPPFINCSDSDDMVDEENYEDEMGDDGSNMTENLSHSKAQKQTKGIFKTNISILAIWIVGICLMVCILTCGCFLLYIFCFDVNRETNVPSRMPLTRFSEYSG